MSRLLFAVLALLLALTMGSLPTFAQSSGGKMDNVAATRAYLLARHRLMLSGQHDEQADEAAVQSLVANVKSECPGVLAAAPESDAREKIREEIAEEVPLTLERPARSATLAFAMTVQRLRWTNRKLTYYATHAAREGAAKEKVALPDICADARAFAADGFKTTPIATEKFLASSDAANSITTIESRPGGETGGLEERIWHLLKPYERPNEKFLISHRPTKQEFEQGLFVLEKDIGTPVLEIAHAVGLPE
jgi:hypothetical protein